MFAAILLVHSTSIPKSGLALAIFLACKGAIKSLFPSPSSGLSCTLEADFCPYSLGMQHRRIPPSLWAPGSHTRLCNDISLSELLCNMGPRRHGDIDERPIFVYE